MNDLKSALSSEVHADFQMNLSKSFITLTCSFGMSLDVLEQFVMSLISATSIVHKTASILDLYLNHLNKMPTMAYK